MFLIFTAEVAIPLLFANNYKVTDINGNNTCDKIGSINNTGRTHWIITTNRTQCKKTVQSILPYGIRCDTDRRYGDYLVQKIKNTGESQINGKH